MAKYQVKASYAGSIGVEVEADNKEDACRKAEEIVSLMSDKVFLYELEPQHLDTEVAQLCSECSCELHPVEEDTCSKCKSK